MNRMSVIALILGGCLVSIQPVMAHRPSLILDGRKALAGDTSIVSQVRKSIDARALQESQTSQDEEDADIRPPRTAPTSVSPTPDPVVWPMRLAEGRPIPVIEAMVNGEGPFLFYLDTGAATTTLNQAFVESLDLPFVGKTSIRGPGEGPGIDADLVTIDRFQVGDVDVRDFEAASFDRSAFSGGEDLAGSIGLSVFGELPVSIDYAKGQIVLGGQGLPDVDGKTVLACDFEGPVPFFQVHLGDEAHQAAFDSGFAGLLLIGEESAQDLTFASEPAVVGRARSVSGEVEIKGATLDGQLRVGDQETVNPMLIIMPAVLTDREICVLGYAWVGELRVTYDSKQGRVSFQSSSQTNNDESDDDQ